MTRTVIIWSVYFLSGALAAAALTTADGVDLGVDGKSIFRSLRASDCSVDCGGVKRRPVCGTDGVTYDSRCDLKRAKKCDGKRVKVRKKGHCSDPNTHGGSGSSKCFQERREAEKISRRQTSDVYIPECSSDGTYDEVQCHKNTGYCWCVTKDGRHIPGTSVRGRRPRCRGKRRRKKQKGRSRRRKACTRPDRQTFNSNLVGVFKEEYDRMVRTVGTTPSSSQDADGDVDTERRVVEWKFTELDKDKDNVLRFKEIRSFGRMVKKLIKPKACAKRFVRNCDSNKNKRIEQSEWTLCLGVDIKDGQSTEAPGDPSSVGEDSPLILPPWKSKPVFIANKPEPKRETTHERKDSRNCVEEREAAMAHHLEEPSANIYIPRCNSDGKWTKAQCHKVTEYCWCVQEETGTPIPGTSTFQVEPNCTLKEDREMKGCPFEQKRRFLVDLMGDLSEEMLGNNRTQAASPIRLPGQQSNDFRERVAKWKLHSLDSNGNGVLDRKEWKKLRKTNLKSKKYPRKCRRNFLRFCDENSDKKVTWDEWKDCLGLNHSYYNTLPLNPKRRGRKNPFIDQLT